MLYADDMLLLLRDTTKSLQTVMSTVLDFGQYSGLTINWSKSALLLLDGDSAQPIAPTCPIPITDKFKYYGRLWPTKHLSYVKQISR